MPAPIPLTVKASNVCWSCRSRKQACDKALPACSRCASKLIRCDYSWNDSELVQKDHRPNELVIAKPLVIRSSCCSDLSTYGASQMIQAASADEFSVPLSRLVRQALDEVKSTPPELADEYFSTLHNWFPILDEQRLRSLFHSWSQDDRPDLALLIWSAHLATRRPCPQHVHSIHSTAYRVAKQVFVIQASTWASIELLQAGLLIALYACGHSMPHDAHMILTSCIGVARLMGMDVDSRNGWAEVDSEASACTAAIVLLDRLIALSNLDGTVPLCLQPDPSSYMGRLGLTMDSKSNYPSFEIASKVALLAGDALAYANNPQAMQWADHMYDGINARMQLLVGDLLERTKTQRESFVYCVSASLAISIFLAFEIANPHSASLGEDSKEAIHLQSTLRMVLDKVRITSSMLEGEDIGGVSAIALCALFRAAAILVRIGRNMLTLKDFAELDKDMHRFGARWAVGDTLLRYMDESAQNPQLATTAGSA